MSKYKIEAGTAQHIGNRPQQNDRTALFTGARAPGYVLAVLADGVQGGASASEQVLHTAKLLFDEFKPGDHPGVERIAQLLREIVHETHMIIKMNAVAVENEQESTMVALVITPAGLAVWAHVGDSRLYRFAKGMCMARTGDADYLEHLIGNDGLDPEVARKYRTSQFLLNLMGNPRKEPFVTIGSHDKLAAGDSFLLCSDGLWHYFTDAELGSAVARHAPRQAAEMLIDKASERSQGKGDNCTMAIIKLVAPPKEEPNYAVKKPSRAV